MGSSQRHLRGFFYNISLYLLVMILFLLHNFILRIVKHVYNTQICLSRKNPGLPYLESYVFQYCPVFGYNLHIP